MDANEKTRLRKVAAHVLIEAGEKEVRLRPALTKLARMLTTSDIALHSAIMKVAKVSMSEAIKMAAHIAKVSEKRANGPYCNPRMAGTKSTTPKVRKPKTITGSPSATLFSKAD